MTISNEELIELALAPKKTVGDEGSVEERSIDELLKVKALLDNAAVVAPPYGMRIAQVKPRGTV